MVTTDGCKDGFSAVLSQHFETTLDLGRVVTRLHPIMFVSKRTSAAEEKYQPYLLEFAGLKFALDKFDDIIFGFPVEVKTDCIALRDTLLSEKLNTTHTRWCDSVLAHHIIDVRHQPGESNVVVDTISRKFTDLPKVDGDGHETTVDPNWEVQRGLVNDVWLLSDNVDGNDDEMAGGWLCQYGGVARRADDRHEWSVSPDTTRGCGAAVLMTETDPTLLQLRARFTDEPVFLQVVDVLLDLDQARTVQEKQRAHHRALGYQIDDGKLWRIGDGKTTRSRPRVKCVSQAEVVELARTEHTDNGHWGRDLVKLALMDRV